MASLPPAMLAIVLALAALIVIAVIYARRAGLLASAIERQMIEYRTQLAAAHQEDVHQTQAATDKLEAEIDSVGKELQSQRAETAEKLGQLSDENSALSARIDAVASTVQLHASYAAETSSNLAVLSDAIETVTRRPLQGFPIDSARLEAKTHEELIALAESIATLRPLVPYPKWRFDADWANPDLAFLLRQRVWQYFNDRKTEAQITVRWHCGTQLALLLGNDLSRQIYVAGCIDPNEFAFLDRFLQPGMTFIDAGANEGVYAVFAAKRLAGSGIVWTFEPSQRELRRLERNLQLNNLTARILPFALAEATGKAELNVAGYGHEGQNTLGAFVYPSIETEGKEWVEMKRLDDVVSQTPPARVDVIKLDVEGAELRLLCGAGETLRRYRPVLLFEASDAALRQQGGSREELLHHLSAQQYDIYFFDPYSGLPSRAADGAISDNMLAVPAGTRLPEAVYQPWPKGA